MKKFGTFLVVALSSVSLVACSSASSPSDTVSQPPAEDLTDPAAVSDQLAQDAMAECNRVVAPIGKVPSLASTVAPITSIVSMVAGDLGPLVVGIVPEGTNSHTYEPPPSVAEVLTRSDVVFLNGLGLEEPTSELASRNVTGSIICEIGTAILPESGWVYDFSFPKEGGKPNPHIWTNPPMVLNMLTVVRDVLANLDPANSDKYDANYVKASQLVSALDTAMAEATATVPVRNRRLLTYHDAYAYFALKYGYEVIGAIQPQSFEEPSPQDIAAIIEQVKTEQVPAIFGSEVFPSPVLEQIGKETGATYIDTLRDDDLPGKPGELQHSWAGLMKYNFATMVKALGGDPSAIEAVDLDVGLVDTAFYPQ